MLSGNNKRLNTKKRVGDISLEKFQHGVQQIRDKKSRDNRHEYRRRALHMGHNSVEINQNDDNDRAYDN